VGAFHKLHKPKSIELETDLKPATLEAPADVFHDSTSLAVISSGTYQTDGMIVIPCSMRSGSLTAPFKAGA
jgi:4-hydroxy-3-polyprenylbenzoate decarboxylase